ncbi:MAG: hypothetical protein ACK4U0_09065 [Mesorhizobium sp.]
MKRLIGWVLSGIIVVLGIAEIGVRTAGFVDFPLYLADSRIGYIPIPNQSGSFMNSNDWAFNELSMGTPEPFNPSPIETDILLIGDSVVFGGNPYKQGDRLGPQLARATGDAVWPISAGSWALQNQLNYLADHPEVVQAVDQIVFLLNGGDFGEPTSWRTDLTHPRSQPLSAVAYLATKYILKPTAQPTPAEMIVPTRDWRGDLVSFAATTTVPITVVIYPDRDGLDDLSAAAELPDLGVDRIISIGDDSRWSKSLYRDAIHPTPEGTGVLATIIAEHLNAPIRPLP